jgi:hypothetical protein
MRNIANSGRKHKGNVPPSSHPRGARKESRSKLLASALCGSVFRNVRQRQVDHDRGVSAMGRMLPVEKITTQ